MQMQATFTRKRKANHSDAAFAEQFAALGRKAQSVSLALTSGTATKAQLRQEGYPYARQALRDNLRLKQRGSRPRLPINKQTEALQRSLRVTTLKQGSEWVLRVRFGGPHVLVLLPGGLKYMVDRGFWGQLRKEVAPFSRASVRTVTSQAFTG